MRAFVGLMSGQLTWPMVHFGLGGSGNHRVSAATRNCPVTATKVPAGGHEKCPVAVMGSARM